MKRGTHVLPNDPMVKGGVDDVLSMLQTGDIEHAATMAFTDGAGKLVDLRAEGPMGALSHIRWCHDGVQPNAIGRVISLAIKESTVVKVTAGKLRGKLRLALLLARPGRAALLPITARQYEEEDNTTDWNLTSELKGALTFF